MEDLVTSFCGITGADEDAARFFMEMSGWNMEQAVSAFFDQGGAAALPARSAPKDIPQRMDVAKDAIERIVSFVPSAYGSHLHKGLRQLLASPLFVDVTLNVFEDGQGEPTRIPAHKFLLSLASQEFKSLLFADREDAMDEEDGRAAVVKEVDVELGHIPLRIFRNMLEFIYTGTTSFDESELLLLIEVAAKFQVTSLREKCGEMLYGENKDVASLMEIAATYGCVKLAQLCAQYFARNWTKASKDGTLMRLSPEMWEELLARDEIEAYEEDIFTALLQYAQDQAYERADRVLEKLLPLIRFPLIETSFLLEEVGKSPVLEILPVTHELLHEAFRYKLHPSQGTLTKRCKPRKGALKWSNSDKSDEIMLNDNRLTASYRASSVANRWSTVLADHYVMTPAQKTYCLRVDSCSSGWIFIGVAGRGWTGWQSSRSGRGRRNYVAGSSTYIGQQAPSWGICSSPGWGRTAPNGSNTPYGPTSGFTTGDVIKISIDMNVRTVSYTLNGVSLGVAFSSLPEEVRLGVTFHAPGDRVTIIQDSH